MFALILQIVILPNAEVGFKLYKNNNAPIITKINKFNNKILRSKGMILALNRRTKIGMDAANKPIHEERLWVTTKANSPNRKTMIAEYLIIEYNLDSLCNPPFFRTVVSANFQI